MLRKLEMSDGGIRKDTLSNRMLRAALLVSEDRLTDEQIAEQAGVKRNALAKWKRREDFKAEVERIRTAARDQVLREGIALKVNRLRRLDEHAQGSRPRRRKSKTTK